MTTTLIPLDLESRLRAVLDEKSLLKHPFYRDWTAGTLPVERLQEYARQYFHFEAAFPRYLSAIHTRTESAPVRQILLENLWDEEYGPRNHRALWLEFAEALGVPQAEVEATPPNAQTTALVEHFGRVCREAPVAEALATLFAYEGQVPAVAWQKITGLRENYGMKPEQFEFFSVHLVADVGHSETEMKAIYETAGDGTTSPDAVIAAAGTACDYLLTFLDGCY